MRQFVRSDKRAPHVVRHPESATVQTDLGGRRSWTNTRESTAVPAQQWWSEPASSACRPPGSSRTMAIDVTVVDRDGVAAGASLGERGLALPRTRDPLERAERPAVRPARPARPARPHSTFLTTVDLGPVAFPAQFAANCRWGRWERAARANLPFNAECLEAFDILTSAGSPCRRSVPPSRRCSSPPGRRPGC